MISEHVTFNQVKKLKDGTLAPEEVIAALEHIETCEHCAEVLAGCYESDELLCLHPDFASEVFASIQSGQRSGTEEKRKKRSGRGELFLYSFKVGIAASIALVLLFSGALDYGVSMGRTLHGDLTGVNRIAESIRGFSDQLIDFKVTTDIKEVL